MSKYLTDLADAARTSGLQVIEVAGWRERGHGAMTAVRGVMLHHTAGAARGDYPSLARVRDGGGDIAGPLSHLGLGRSGAVYVIAAGKCYHAGAGAWPGLTGNGDVIGIEAESTGTGDSPWTDAQKDAYPRLVRALARHYRVPSARVIGHKEWAPRRKIDPYGIDMAAVRRFVDESATPAPAPAAPPASVGRRPDRLPVLGPNLPLVGGWVYLVQEGVGIPASQRANRYGPATTKGVRALRQRFNMLPLDAGVDQWTWVAIIKLAGVLRPGRATGHVGLEVLQNMLGLRGADLTRVYDARTVELVKQTQLYGGLTPDGVVGDETLAVLGRA